jgi:hypothetical protein
MTAIHTHTTNTTGTSDDISVLALPSIHGMALAILLDAGGFGVSIDDGIVLERGGSQPIVARLPYTSEGLATLAGTPFSREVDGSDMLSGVRKVYKTIDPKARTMGKKPSGSAMVKRLLSILDGSGIDHKDEIVSSFRRDVWAIAPADPALAADAPEGTASSPVTTDNGETVYVPFCYMEHAVECNALAAALRFLTAADSLKAPSIKKRGKLCVVPAKAGEEGVSYRLVKMITLDDVAAILASIGWRTPGGGSAQVVLPTVDASVKAAICSDDNLGEAVWARVYVANKAAINALADVKMEAVASILGGKPPVLTAKAARAVETGSYYAEMLRSLGREDLIQASQTLGAINGVVEAVSREK